MAKDEMFMTLIAAKQSGSLGTFWSTVLGALVGGSVSLGTTLLVEWQRTRAARDAENRRNLAAARLAARVVVLELRNAESVLRVAIERSPFEWPPIPNFEFTTQAWKTHYSQLSAALPDDAWNLAAVPYSSFEYSNLLRKLNQSTAQTMLETTQQAIHALECWSQRVRNRPEGC
jgi:hypothetical protein